ncbi:MAG TPA: GntR family transcriptional regulator [Terricaulis sp.]|nr:GntR family transcriptional regulator [Terricaulis sp.]
MSPPRLEVRTLSDRLVEGVRDFILSGAISSDEPIRQDAMAAALHVSKIPLREALARLEQDGLVVSYPNRGFFVRPMSPEEAEEIYELRLKLEPDAAARGSLNASDAERAHAREALALLDVDAAAHKQTVGALNRAFHMALVTPGAGSVTANLVARLHVMADRYVRKHLEPKGRFIEAEAAHHEILDAWLDIREADVRRLVSEHLENTLADLRIELSAEADFAPKPAPARKNSRK